MMLSKLIGKYLILTCFESGFFGIESYSLEVIAPSAGYYTVLTSQHRSVDLVSEFDLEKGQRKSLGNTSRHMTYRVMLEGRIVSSLRITPDILNLCVSDLRRFSK